MQLTLKLKLTEIVIGTEADRQIRNGVEVTNSSLRGCGELVAEVRCFTPIRLVRRGCGKQTAHGLSPDTVLSTRRPAAFVLHLRVFIIF